MAQGPAGGADEQSVSWFNVFENRNYLSIETFRANGIGVRTPVWFAVAAQGASDAGRRGLYIYTTADSGKAKRIRRNGKVRIAPCDVRGTVTGPWLDAVAEIVTGDRHQEGMRRLNRKYWPWKQILNLSACLFRRHDRVVIEIRPS